MRSFHQGEFPNFAGNFTWGTSQLYGIDQTFIEIYSILQNHLPEKVSKQFFRCCGYCEAPEGHCFTEL